MWDFAWEDFLVSLTSLSAVIIKHLLNEDATIQMQNIDQDIKKKVLNYSCPSRVYNSTGEHSI